MKGVRWQLKLRVAGHGLIGTLRRPRYLLLALVLSVMFTELIYWLDNLPLLHYVLTVPTLSPAAKLQFMAGTYADLWQSTASPLAVSLLLLSVVQGCTLSLLVFTLRRQRAGGNAIRAIGGSGLAGVLATLGLGCAACGTSLLTPILVFLFSTSSVALADQVGLGVAIVGLLAGGYGLYAVASKAAAVIAD